ncbi:MAG: YqaE/Pmp3 family membrane protein [Robiginitomaculum sp.]|nr:MAG: YqaE/Pmp3 family membrane protein [Robiginitomaculum sp.]PHQ66741.1 MAG: YqaE/Pmp3 family membrane protein [Robiginitomaculum sp.]
MILVAILFPWLSFFLRGKIIQGILCLVLQITIIGWLPAAIWAVASRNEAKMDQAIKRAERNIIDANRR